MNTNTNSGRKIDERCECCGQTLYTASKLSKGNATMMRAISEFIEKKGHNVFHPAKELVNQGYITNNMRGNISHLGNHGLIAKHKKHGNWVLTTRGLQFLNDVEVWRAVAIDKSTKITIGYIESEGKTNMSKLLGESENWTGINFDIVDGEVQAKY